MMYKWEGISQASNFFVYCRMRKKNNTKRQYKLSNINCDNGTFQSHYHISFINNWEQNKTGFFLLLIVFVCFHSETTIFWLKKKANTPLILVSLGQTEHMTVCPHQEIIHSEEYLHCTGWIETSRGFAFA